MPVSGRILSDKERVSSQIISNWFANKRKDMKRLAREEGYDPAQFQLRGKGRPTRYGSMALQPHSVDPLFGVSPATVEGLTTSPTGSSSAKNIAEMDVISAGDLDAMEPMAGRIGNMLEQVVEFAAVNQAILSLSGQTPVCPLKSLNSKSNRPAANEEKEYSNTNNDKLATTSIKDDDAEKPRNSEQQNFTTDDSSYNSSPMSVPEDGESNGMEEVTPILNITPRISTSDH